MGEDDAFQAAAGDGVLPAEAGARDAVHAAGEPAQPAEAGAGHADCAASLAAVCAGEAGGTSAANAEGHVCQLQRQEVSFNAYWVIHTASGGAPLVSLGRCAK